MPGTLEAKEIDQVSINILYYHHHTHHSSPQPCRSLSVYKSVYLQAVVVSHAQSEESVEPCADLAKAKDACLAEGGDCAELVKTFMNCMDGVGTTQ